MITARTVYTYDGKDYDTKTQVLNAVDDDIGNIIDDVLKNGCGYTPFSAGQLLAVHKMLCDNRDKFVELLSIKLPYED